MIIGIDIGGSKILISFSDETGKLKKTHRLKTKDYRTAEDGLVAIAKIIEEEIPKKLIQSIGISAPGPLSIKKGTLIKPPNLPGWEMAPLVQFFKKRFSTKVYLNNDANAAALAEYHFGKRKNTANLIYLTCSSGIGAGIIINHKLLVGATDTAGEVGHFVLDIHQPPCLCGQTGCFEMFAGGLAVREKSGREDFFETLKEHLKEPDTRKLFDEYVERLAQGIGILIMTLNPDVIILGTIAYHLGDTLMLPLKEKLKKYAWKEPLEACIIEPTSIYENLSALSGISVSLDGNS